MAPDGNIEVHCEKSASALDTATGRPVPPSIVSLASLAQRALAPSLLRSSSISPHHPLHVVNGFPLTPIAACYSTFQTQSLRNPNCISSAYPCLINGPNTRGAIGLCFGMELGFEGLQLYMRAKRLLERLLSNGAENVTRKMGSQGKERLSPQYLPSVAED
ncbi:hypothetical protein BDV96DRAFT_596920 [Lophiotrema nucula]|uniref:Uncharacterized protein n=1 Tax=Lophiotrema nucula TaxID=690887 RepID=A0A6A5ZI34_9PLEO|nr:hypothetical protein BDV96DRAFT_596920 [Lophiotrema nucula]